MAFETEGQQREIQRWSRIAIQFIGAADSGRFDHITTAVVVRELEGRHLFEFVTRERPASVLGISGLTDVDRHKLSQHWQMLAKAYDPDQFHVSRSGLAARSLGATPHWYFHATILIVPRCPSRRSQSRSVA